MEKENSSKKIVNEMISLIILPLCIFFMVDLFFVICNFNFYIILTSTEGLILSILICFSIFFMLCAATGKTYNSIISIAIFLLIFSIINQIKIAYTNDPIVLTDILFLGNSKELLNIIDNTLTGAIKHNVLPMLIYTILTIIICIIAKKKNVSVPKKERIVFLSISLVFIIILIIPLNFTRNIFLNVVFKVNNRKDYAYHTTNLEYYLNYGVISGMYGQLLENRITEPENYNEEKINIILGNVKDNEEKFLGKPNIITIFSESFWNIDELEEIEFNQKIASNFEKLKNNGIFFDMISPSYGGVSANVEFEFLTGANLMFFNRGYVPYMQLYTNKASYNKPSLISELNKNAYKTKIVSYASDKLFNCGKVYNYMQVDETKYITDYEDNIKGYYTSDEKVIDDIICEFNNKKKGQKEFYMALTMQSHMPYVKEKYNKYDIEITKSNLTQEMNDTILSYAQGIYDADKQLKRLYDYIQTLDEPTIIVFYGDHLPYLKTANGIDIFNELQYFNTNNELLNQYRKYNTQALILANYQLKESEFNYISPDLLGAYILNNMNINISQYYKYLHSTKDILPAANYLVSTDLKGNLYNTKELKGKMKEVYDLRECIQYKFFIK